jgi:ankyrin repeat protein
MVSGNRSMMKLLLDRGASINIIITKVLVCTVLKPSLSPHLFSYRPVHLLSLKVGMALLHLAVVMNDCDLVSFLLDRGAAIDTTDTVYLYYYCHNSITRYTYML